MRNQLKSTSIGTIGLFPMLTYPVWTWYFIIQGEWTSEVFPMTHTHILDTLFGHRFLKNRGPAIFTKYYFAPSCTLYVLNRWLISNKFPANTRSNDMKHYWNKQPVLSFSCVCMQFSQYFQKTSVFLSPISKHMNNIISIKIKWN